LRGFEVNRLRWVFPFYLGYLLIPRPLQHLLGVPVGFVLSRLMRRSRDGVRRNLAGVLGPAAGAARREALLWRTFYKYGLYLLDYLVFALGGPERTRALVGRPAGAEPLFAALAAGRGAIIVSPHLGNWELGGAALARVGRAPLGLTARRGERALERHRERVRGRMGMRFIAVDEAAGAAAGLVEAARVLRAGGVVAMLADRPAGGRTVAAPFFGRPCRFPAGPAALALATGAPIFPAAVVLERGFRYRIAIGAPIEPRARGPRDEAIRAATAAIATAFEGWIRAYPDQWYNFYDYFAEAAAAPPAGREARAAADSEPVAAAGARP
jgi:KDO2-lipid IV(A) lauroyltransferase